MVKQVLDLTQSLGVHCELIRNEKRGSDMNGCGSECGTNPANAEIETVAQNISTAVNKHLEGSTELVLVHLDAQCEIVKHSSQDTNMEAYLSEQTRHCYRVLDATAQKIWGDLDLDVLQCVVIGGDATLREGALGKRVNTEDQAEMAHYTPRKKRRTSLESSSEDLLSLSGLSYLRPTQSSSMHNGRQLDDESDGVDPPTQSSQFFEDFQLISI